MKYFIYFFLLPDFGGQMESASSDLDPEGDKGLPQRSFLASADSTRTSGQLQHLSTGQKGQAQEH